MAQNKPMGAGMAPPPASPANPTALNFQSDPNMRQQFKGFMSGLSNRPMPQPMPAPMPMYTPAANVDIFEPVQGFANGGGVTFSSGSDYSPGGGISISSGTVQGDDTFGGGNDRRDSIGLNDPYEAEMIQTGRSFLDDFGLSTSDDSGPVAFGVGARPSVNLSARTMPASGGDALSQQISKRSVSGYDDAPMDSRGLSTNQGQANAAMGRGSGFGAAGATKSITGSPTASGYDDFGLDVLNLLGNVDLLDSDAVMRQALDSSARLMRDAYGQVAVNPELTGLPGGAAVVSGRPIQTPDEIAYNDTMMQTDMSPADMQRIGREREAQRLSLGGGQVDVDPVTGEVSSIPVPASRPSTLIDYTDPTQISRSVDIASPMSRPGTLIDYTDPTQVPISSYEQGKAAGEKVAQGQPSVGGLDESLVGSGDTPLADAREEFDTKGARAPADQGFFGALMDTMTGREYPTDEEIQQNIVDAANARTRITGDKRRQDMSALDQLANRAGREGSGIFSALTNFGASNAAKMYEDIVNRGYEPVYGAAGQIVATRVPGTEMLGRGSVESRIPGYQPSTEGEPAPQPSVADLVAAELKRLGVGQEGDAPAPVTPPPSATPTTPSVPSAPTPQAPAPLARPLGFGYGQIQGINPNLDTAANKFLSLLGGYAEGGEVKNFEFGGGVDEEEAELSEAITGSYTTAGGGQATGFSYDDGGDDGGSSVQSVMAAPVQKQTVVATPLDGPAPQTEKLVSVESSELQPQVNQQMAPKQDVRSRIASVAEASTPSFSSMLGDLFSFDAPEGNLSDLERAQLDVRGRMAERGSDYYGQNLPQNIGQSLAEAGMTPANTQYMDVLSSGQSGGSRYGGGLQDIGVQYQSPQQVAAGVQAGVQGAFDSLGRQFAQQR